MPIPAPLKFSALPKTSAGLVALHVPRSIHDAAAYDNAVEIVHALAGFKLMPTKRTISNSWPGSSRTTNAPT